MAARGGGPAVPPPRFVVALALGALLAGGARPAAADPALSGCRRLADDRERLACYDALAGPPAAAPAAAATGAVPAAAANPATAGAPPAPAAAAADLFGRDPREAEALARAAAGIGSTDSIEARVARLARDPYGKLELVLDNGQTWKQTDSAALALKAGATVRIRRAALDSYLLALRDGGTSIRVRRVR